MKHIDVKRRHQDGDKRQNNEREIINAYEVANPRVVNPREALRKLHALLWVKVPYQNA